jgi:hypothetical protein
MENMWVLDFNLVRINVLVIRKNIILDFSGENVYVVDTYI